MTFSRPTGRNASLLSTLLTSLLAALGWASAPLAAAQAWQPTAPIEIVVPAGTGGGADQMARLIQAIAAKHKLSAQPITVVNKPGDSGAEGMLALKASKGDPHKLIITLSSLFTTPLSTGTAFNWRDLTPVSMMALDQFVLWVHADSPLRSAREAVKAIASGAPGSYTLGGTGAKQEDQILSVLLETAAGRRLNYTALKGGGDVARALAAREVDFTVNNPIEAEALWRDGKLRPLCVFDGARLAVTAKVAGNQAWSDLPTCMSEGVPAQYLMLRGVFAAGGITPQQGAWHEAFLTRVRQTSEWREFMQRGALKDLSLAGPAYVEWLESAERFHFVLMRESRLIAR